MNIKFGRYFMILFSIILLAGIIRIVGCKGSFPQEPVEKPLLVEPCEKDGVVKIIVSEQIDDTTRQLIDSLAISETLNAVDMTNAVKMTFPQTYAVSFFFFGHLEGMENRVGVWHEGYSEDDYFIRYSTHFDMIRNSSGVSYLMRLDNIVDTTRTLNAYAVLFDDDDAHSGEGIVVVTTQISCDTFRIESSKNTVNYQEKASVLEFQLSESTKYYGITCHDKESFVSLKHDAIWVLKRRLNPEILEVATSRRGHGLVNEQPEREYTLYGFAPVF